jgi:hypothetical protein
MPSVPSKSSVFASRRTRAARLPSKQERRVQRALDAVRELAETAKKRKKCAEGIRKKQGLL